MKPPVCHVCGSTTDPIRTDLPFKRGQHAILIVKDLPVFQCTRCREFLLEDIVMDRVEAILRQIDESAELEVIRYAA